MSEVKRYEKAPETIKDFEYLIWCARSAKSDYVRNIARTTLLQSRNDNSIVLLVDLEAMQAAPHEFDCDEQATYAFRIFDNLEYENLGPAYEYKTGQYVPVQYPTLNELEIAAKKEAAKTQEGYEAEYRETNELVDALAEIKPALSRKFGEGRVIDKFTDRADGGYNPIKDALPDDKKHLAWDLVAVLAAGSGSGRYYYRIFESDLPLSYDYKFYQKAARALARRANPTKPQSEKPEKKSEPTKSKNVDLSFLTFTDESNQPKKEEPQYNGSLATEYTMRGKTYRFEYPTDADEEEIDRLAGKEQQKSTIKGYSPLLVREKSS